MDKIVEITTSKIIIIGTGNKLIENIRTPNTKIYANKEQSNIDFTQPSLIYQHTVSFIPHHIRNQFEYVFIGKHTKTYEIKHLYNKYIQTIELVDFTRLITNLEQNEWILIDTKTNNIVRYYDTPKTVPESTRSWFNLSSWFNSGQ